MIIWFWIAFGWIALGMVPAVHAEEARISGVTDECLGCHAALHPGIVESWKKSRHARTTPATALAVEGLSRKLSSPSVPEDLKGTSVGCGECHTISPQTHKDTFEHNGYSIHVVVTPKDCATCHAQESEQFDRNLMSHAHGNLVGNSLYQHLVQSINGLPVVENARVVMKPAGQSTDEESCLYCHGTRLVVKESQTRETEMGSMEFPVIAGWPNRGVGRINPDDSRGNCAACHSRHDFSLEMARKPYTCKECHVGPDVPAMKVYEASKHGNIFSARGESWDYGNVPWTIGKDFTAPTCAACHMSLLTDTEGKVVVERSHEVKDRLPWRIFGLIYAHPHPRDADITGIQNTGGLPLPTELDGRFVDKFLFTEQEREKARKTMQAACLKCHDASWVDGHWERFMGTIQYSNGSTLAATRLMQEIWNRDLAVNHTKGGNPFDEFIERVWSDVWLFYANTVRFSSAMGGGGDYSVFAEGRYHLSKAVRELEDWLNARKPTAGKGPSKK
jgi:hydroxylamine dehydrogenase